MNDIAASTLNLKLKWSRQERLEHFVTQGGRKPDCVARGARSDRTRGSILPTFRGLCRAN
eukprot:scaffold238563_cov31-Tisochrysis_lutea.AAC.3